MALPLPQIPEAEKSDARKRYDALTKSAGHASWRKTWDIVLLNPGNKEAESCKMVHKGCGEMRAVSNPTVTVKNHICKRKVYATFGSVLCSVIEGASSFKKVKFTIGTGSNSNTYGCSGSTTKHPLLPLDTTAGQETFLLSTRMCLRLSVELCQQCRAFCSSFRRFWVTLVLLRALKPNLAEN